MATIQGIYLARFGRPADPAGLEFFSRITKNGSDLSGLASVTSSPEYLGRFVGQTTEQIIGTFFKTMFNRELDQGSLDYWTKAITAGRVDINYLAIAMLDGARNVDLFVLNNKIAAANIFTASLDTQAKIDAYRGGQAVAAAQNFLEGVTYNVPTTTEVAAVVTNVVALQTATTTTTPDPNQGNNNPNQPPGLTTGTDSLSGDSANNVVAAAVDQRPNGVTTLQTADTVNGGAGTDTLNVTVNGLDVGSLIVAPTLKDVEKLSITNLSDKFEFGIDLANATGVTEVGFQGAVAGSFTIYKNVTVGATISLDALGGGAKPTTATVMFADPSSRTGNTDAVNVAVKNGSSGQLSLYDLSANPLVDGSFEVLNITASGAASKLSYLASKVNTEGFSTINAAGTAAGDMLGYGLTIVDAGAGSPLSKIDASGMSGTGGLNIDASKTSATSLQFTGSGVNDRLLLGSTWLQNANAPKLDGGLGSDTIALRIDDAAFTLNGSLMLNGTSSLVGVLNDVNRVKGFEVLELAGDSIKVGAVVLDAPAFNSIQTFRLSGGAPTGTPEFSGEVFAFTNVQSQNKVEVSSSIFPTSWSANGNDGKAALSFSAYVNNAVNTPAVPQTANLSLIGGVTIKGQNGADGIKDHATANGGIGGLAAVLDLRISKLTIESIGDSPNSLLGGDGGAGGAKLGGGLGKGGWNGAAIKSLYNSNSAGFDVAITGSQDLTIAPGSAGKGSGAIDFGTLATGFNSRVNVDASSFTGKLKISLSNDIDTIAGGRSDDVIYGAMENDLMSGGGGNDQFVFLSPEETRANGLVAGASDIKALDQITDFAGNGAAAGDTFRFGEAGRAFAFSDVTFGSSTVANVTAATLTQADTFGEIFTGLGTRTASTAATAQFYDITVDAGVLKGRYLILQDGKATTDFGSDLILHLSGISGALNPQDIIFAS